PGRQSPPDVLEGVHEESLDIFRGQSTLLGFAQLAIDEGEIDVGRRQRLAKRLARSGEGGLAFDEVEIRQDGFERAAVQDRVPDERIEADLPAIQHARDDVVYLIVAQRLTHPLKLVHETNQDRALSGGLRDKVHDLNLVLLPVAVNATHALLEAIRVPGQVPVDHDPTELQVDALTRCVRCNHELCRSTKLLLCRDAVLELHPAMNGTDAVPPLPELLREVRERVPVLGEDENLLVLACYQLVLKNPLKLPQFHFGSPVHRRVGPFDKVVELTDLGCQLLRRAG